MSAAHLGPRAQRTVLAGMVAYVALGAFEALAVATAMPTVAAELDGLRLYTLAFAAGSAAGVVGMLVAGRWTDRRGPTPPLLAGISLFLAGLLVAGLAPSMPVLLVGRALQGVGSGIEGVAIFVLVARVFPEERRAKVFAWFAAAWVVPGVVGPLLAGAVTQYLGWRWVFLAVPVLAVPALLALRPALAAGRRSGPATPSSPPAGPPAAESGEAAAWRDVVGQVLRGDRGLGSVVLVRALVAAAFVGAQVLLPLALTRERGLAPAFAGAVLTLHVLGWSAGSWARGRGLGGMSHAGFLRLGGASLALGTAGVALLVLPSVPLVAAAAPWVLSGLGMGLMFPTLNLLVLELAPPAAQGVSMSVLQVADAAASALALTGTGALLWALHDRVGAAAYAVCLALAAVLALVATALAGRTRPAPSRAPDSAPRRAPEDAVTNSLATPSGLGDAAR
ncbi:MULTISPECIES: MFS transporter [unclassified Isoptericola]|uniref:MFS transporter n=1 Tax=unclassified Isoptericola TaxID=2623355 RepID=UPI00366A1B80